MSKTQEYVAYILGLIGAIVSTTLILTTSLDEKFENKAHAKEFREMIDKRLDRIENKIDKILGRDP